MRQAMAEQQRRRKKAQSRPSRRRRPARKVRFDWTALLPKRKTADFKPDNLEGGFWKFLHMTQAQKDRYAKWGLYIAVIAGLLMIQDVIMSQIHIYGATTDLAVCAILLITVMEGSEVGSVFVLIASTLYYLAGTTPGPHVIAILTFYGIGACMFRQMFWHRNRASIVLCAGLAMMAYEMTIFGVGIFQGLTRWDRAFSFALCGVYNWAVMIPLYTLIQKIGLIGENTWKE